MLLEFEKTKTNKPGLQLPEKLRDFKEALAVQMRACNQRKAVA